jgi:hypothetical protein
MIKAETVNSRETLSPELVNRLKNITELKQEIGNINQEEVIIKPNKRRPLVRFNELKCDDCKFFHDINKSASQLINNYKEMQFLFKRLKEEEDLDIPNIVRVQGLMLKYLTQLQNLYFNTFKSERTVKGAQQGPSINVQLNQKFGGPTNYNKHQSFAKSLVSGIDQERIIENVNETDHGVSQSKPGNSEPQIDNLMKLIEEG